MTASQRPRLNFTSRVCYRWKLAQFGKERGEDAKAGARSSPAYAVPPD